MILLQALATTNQVSEKGVRDQWRGSRGGTNNLTKRWKMRGLAQNSREEKRGKRGREGRGLDGPRDRQSHDGGVPSVESQGDMRSKDGGAPGRW